MEDVQIPKTQVHVRNFTFLELANCLEHRRKTQGKARQVGKFVKTMIPLLDTDQVAFMCP